MIEKELLIPPEHIYPNDEWRLVEKRYAPEFVAQNETIFALSNGYLGMRGAFEEGLPVFQGGTFINGFYETWPIVYGEDAFGFAKTGQTMLNVTDGRIIKLYVDDEPFVLYKANILEYERALDMREGTLNRRVLWETPSGKKVSIVSRRMVSFEHRHVAVISYEVTVHDVSAPVVLVSQVRTGVNGRGGDEGDEDLDDPRLARSFQEKVLQPKLQHRDGQRMILIHKTANSRLGLACGVDHTLETECPSEVEVTLSEDAGAATFSVDAEPGKAVRLVKYICYHTSGTAPPEELRTRVERTLKRVIGHGFDRLLDEQKAHLQEFWHRSDVKIKAAHPRAQQFLRFNLFHLFQAAARAEGAGIPAKGLTGQAYEGHYFWDSEVYVMPFLVYTAPRLARNMLKYRYSILDKARQRAREVNQKGALFPWRTINGEEASAYYAAGTAQYHINADIMYALKKYVEVTGDEEFLFQYGAEMLVETARLWADLGFYLDDDGGRFHIHGVTGPDEYNTVVNNNTFTNLMARENLWYAVATVEKMKEADPERFTALVHDTKLREEEVGEWKRAADCMYVPFDEEKGIHPQDDNFLNKEIWDFENTPIDKYPLLLNYHPLVIYRYQVVKQADVAMAMFLLGHEFTAEQKRTNFDYYDPLTTGDSSLAACIQSIVAWELGDEDKALRYLRYALLMDLADIGGNVKDGVHIASMGGTWMAVVYGVAGLRDWEGRISFHPRLPEKTSQLNFHLTVRGRLMEVDIREEGVTYALREGEELTIEHRGEEITLRPGQAVTRDVAVPGEAAARVTEEGGTINAE
jgi:alpha,alpha-trehalose phosphorylase